MAAIQTTITLTHRKETIQTIKDKLLRPAPAGAKNEFTALKGYFHAAAGGDRDLQAVVQVNSGDAAAATGTITLSGFVATNTFTIGSETFTCMASGASGQNQFNVGGSDTLSAAAAVLVINSNTNLAQTITATSSGAVITVTSKVPGRIGNYVGLAISAHGSVSAATLASGADATTYSSQNTYHSGV